MAKIFTYITFKNGVPDDSALELVTAAKKIAADATPIAVVVGSGTDALCDQVAASYAEVWKVDNEALAYPNAEVIRKVLSNILPPGLHSPGAARHLWHGPVTGSFHQNGFGLHAGHGRV